MSSLYTRATPSQARILRAVEGAVKNAADAHPEYRIDRRFCKSVAKRAAGTLTAQWPDVLAAGMPSEKAAGLLVGTGSRNLATQSPKGERRGVFQHNKRPPLVLLRAQIVKIMHTEKQAGDVGRVSALIDVLRMIAELGVVK